MVEEEDVGVFSFAQKDCLLFGEGKPLNLLTLTQESAILSRIQSPADNWQPGLVSVVTVVFSFELKQRAPAGCLP